MTLYYKHLVAEEREFLFHALICLGEIVITVLYVQLQTIYLLIADFREGSMYKFKAQTGVCPFALLLLQRSKNIQCKPSDQRQHILPEHTILVMLCFMKFA